jgi:hypothetical protein
MGEWKNEDDIKAELRILTGELKQLREELRDMVAPPKQNPSRAFLHRQAWPAAARKPDIVGDAPARKRPAGKRRTDKGR